MEMSEEQHWEVLAALFEHGADAKAVATELSNPGPGNIEHYIKCSRISAKRRESEQENVGDEAYLNTWLSFVRNMQILEGTFDGNRKGRRQSFQPKDHGRLLSKVMFFLSEEEEHPPPSSSTDPDYKEIYRYLGQVLAGDEPSQLSQGSATMVLKMLGRVEKVAAKSKHRGKVNNRLHLHPPPYLPSWRKPADQRMEGKDRSSPECPLFSTGDDEVLIDEEEIPDLQQDDANYETKKQQALEKCQEMQEAIASSLTNIPGLNPFAFPHDLLIKPQDINEMALKDS